MLSVQFLVHCFIKLIFYFIGINNNNATPRQRAEESVFAGTKGTIIICLMALLVFIVAVAVIKKFFLTPSTAQQSPPVALTNIECGLDNKAVY